MECRQYDGSETDGGLIRPDRTISCRTMHLAPRIHLVLQCAFEPIPYFLFYVVSLDRSFHCCCEQKVKQFCKMCQILRAKHWVLFWFRDRWSYTWCNVQLKNVKCSFFLSQDGRPVHFRLPSLLIRCIKPNTCSGSVVSSGISSPWPTRRSLHWPVRLFPLFILNQSPKNFLSYRYGQI